MKRFFLAVLVLAVSGCVRVQPPAVKVVQEQPETTAANRSSGRKRVVLSGSLWELMSDKNDLSGKRNFTPSVIRIRFSDDGFYRGRAGNIPFYGQYIRMNDNKIRIAAGLVKEELDPEDQPSFELFMKNMTRADAFRLHGRQLILLQRGKEILRFREIKVQK